MEWACEAGGDLPAVVYPINDLREHVIDGTDCWCRPVEDEDGTIVHNSLDGRELFETGERKKS